MQQLIAKNEDMQKNLQLMFEKVVDLVKNFESSVVAVMGSNLSGGNITGNTSNTSSVKNANKGTSSN
jgi:hypothetical protein